MKVANLLHKPLNFDRTDDLMFWSDLHLRHDRDFIYEPAGFKSVLEMNTKIKERWCESVTSETTLFLLGDSAFGQNSGEFFLKFLINVPFKRLFLMSGNHDTTFRDILGEYPKGDFYIHDKRVTLIPNYFEINVRKRLVVLSHYPIVSFNKQGKGAYHLHGHTHGNLHLSEIMRVIYSGRVMDVGTVNTPRPISFRQVDTIMSQVKPVVFDHHT